MELDEFRKNFNGYDLSTEFIELKYFQDQHPDYSDGFYLLVDDKAGLRTWSDNKEFLRRLMPFAQANGTGSIYAIWNDGSDRPLNELPIIVFGDEGGVHVVADNLLQLMEILTFDTEIFVDSDQAYFYIDQDDYNESHDNPKYKSWLKEKFNVEPVTEPNELITTAQMRYKVAFVSWFRQFYKNE